MFMIFFAIYAITIIVQILHELTLTPQNLIGVYHVHLRAIKSRKIVPCSEPFVKHCVKSVQIRSFFLVLISCIRTEFRIQYEYRKIRTRKNSISTKRFAFLINFNLFLYPFSWWFLLFIFRNKLES